MGLDVSSHLLVGVKVERFSKTTEKRKFDEDTGEPKTVKTTEKAFRIVGTSIEINEPEHCVNYQFDDDWFLGIEVDCTGKESSPGSFEVEIDILPFEQARNLLKSAGCTLEPMVFVYTHFSY